MEIPDAKSLQSNHTVSVTKNNEIYKVVLKRCVEQIIYTNKTSDQTYTVFTVPLFLIGVVLYNRSSCIIYIMEELSRKNYIVKFVEPNYIHIDWGKKIYSDNNARYIKKILENNPDAKIEFVYQ